LGPENKTIYWGRGVDRPRFLIVPTKPSASALSVTVTHCEDEGSPEVAYWELQN